MLGLVDCNNFYASCERVFRPDLAAVPVAVLSNNDGCIIARSPEIKALGVPMGAPWFQWRSRLEAAGAAVFSANFALYGDLSARVMGILEEQCPAVEVYSIDEAFIDLSPVPPQEMAAYCRHLRQLIARCTGIPVSIGVAPSKTLAKLANQVAKQHPLSGGVWRLLGSERQRLESLPVTEVWGVGRRLARRLERAGIATVWQLRQCPPARARQLYSVNLETTVRELRGEPCRALDLAAAPRQQILVSRSFGRCVSDEAQLRAALVSFASRAGEKLRSQHSLCQRVGVFVRGDRFAEGGAISGGQLEMVLSEPSSDPVVLARAARRGLAGLYRPGERYKKAGVILQGLLPERALQGELWVDDSGRPDCGRVMDAVNGKMGQGALYLASSSVGSDWRMNQQYRSPRYTTRWCDLPEVS
ncbi:MAG: Y-family DNA polymerase [Pseudomonadota bacterium]